MQPVVPDYQPAPGPIALPPPSRLRRGDWLVIPDARLNQQLIRLDEGRPQLCVTLLFGRELPVRTTPCFYGGRVPLEHQTGPALLVRIYKVQEDFTPRAADEAPFPPPLPTPSPRK
jgi:hypothetical protein